MSDLIWARIPTRSLRAAQTVSLVLVAGAALWSVTAAGAAAVEQLGGGSSAAAKPSCPGAPCEVITDTTGFQASISGLHDTMVAQHAGLVTSWSITLSDVTNPEIAFFDSLAHGPASAELVVLSHVSGYEFRVSAAGPIVALAPYFGRTTSFDLAAPLPVSAGDDVALSVPTWAPALDVPVNAQTAWRASRPSASCNDLFEPTAQTTTGGLAEYECIYHTARLAYTATVTDTPVSTARAPARPQATGSKGTRKRPTRAASPAS